MAHHPDGGKSSSDEFRLRLQLETSLLAWVNTSLALMGFGFVVARFGLFLRELAQVGTSHFQPHPHLAWLNTVTGVALILLGVTVLLLAVANHRILVRRLEQGKLELPPRWSLGVVLSLVLAGLGVGMAVYLAAVEF